ncbi:MAG: TetR/AcrR family transcriptional regulator [Nocardioides sp.]
MLEATAALIIESGYAAVTIAAIAERAGTTKPAIYRRWPSKAHLVHEAVFPDGESMSLPASASFADDVREMLRRTAAAFSEPAARAALPGLLGEITADPTLHTVLLDRFSAVWVGLDDRLAAAAEAGEVRSNLDPAALLEAISGSVLMALLIRTTPTLDDTWIDHTAVLLTKGITP